MSDPRMGQVLPEHARCDCPPDIQGRHFLECMQRRDRELLEEAERENDHLRKLLDRAHDTMVTVMNDIVTTRGRIAKEKYRRRYRAAGSCVVCGAEAQKDRSRCLDCARKNSACVKRRRATRAA